ncbi:methyl-accepting chemotaxis protein [Litoreibacter roseus]|uniref:Methyl-accepting chemotaxis protein n=1 Tax=Litoreibacter roseus TaxID=2601869 RepID=A0A6N6JC14_9RHOB|nr:methyl-accepting chemotaxis protein [Litoreibacter roseus]GFE63686.1 methyl-accepting chemotaxis protein [Litoreibacter roseus]
MQKLTQFRLNGRPWLAGLMILNTLAALCASITTDGETLRIGIVATIFAAVGLYILRGIERSSTNRAIFGIIAQAQVAVFVSALAGHPWQVDAHMHFFATMGILILLVDPRAIIAGAATVALHHVVLNFVLPELVYPGGADISRAIMHAVILFISTAALGFASLVLSSITLEAEANAAAREDMVDMLNSSLGHVVRAGVAGDFSCRVEESFAEKRLQRIADGINELIQTVDTGISETSRVMSNISHGDLTTAVAGDYKGAFASLQTDVNATITELRHIVSEIDAASTEISNESAEISAGSERLSSQTAQQAASVEETAAMMVDMAASVKVNVTSAGRMARLASATSQKAQASQEIVENATGAMSRLTESAGQISQIVAVIDQISSQTNLLALNASVEAARAGEAGLGFAVVAQEVRALAQRSTESAKDIRELIDRSSNEVADGVKLVNKVGVALTDIVSSIAEVADMTGQIAKTSEEQSGSVQGASSTVSSIDQITQQTATSAEEYSQKSRRLQTCANKLQDVLQIFRSQPQQATDTNDASASGKLRRAS